MLLYTCRSHLLGLCYADGVVGPCVLENRQAANEAVEAALSSADADREETRAELAATMQAEVRPPTVELGDDTL